MQLSRILEQFDQAKLKTPHGLLFVKRLPQHWFVSFTSLVQTEWSKIILHTSDNPAHVGRIITAQYLDAELLFCCLEYSTEIDQPAFLYNWLGARTIPHSRSQYEEFQLRQGTTWNMRQVGHFDKQGRWYPDDNEYTPCCHVIRSPSVAYPYSLLSHCRSLAHIVRRDINRAILTFKKEIASCDQ